MRRFLLIFAVLVLCVSGLRAQYFEWAKGYSSSQEGNQIVGSVTDSAGNLYILGEFRNTAAWDGGSHLLPIAPYGPNFDVTNVLIAKITPDGTMAWKKVLHGNNCAQSFAYDIKPVGDTAFACMVSFELPAEGSNYLYYLDTLLPTTSDYPIPHDPMTYLRRLALIIFDFDGHVQEQHFLTLTYLDYNGNDIMREGFPGRYMNAASFQNVSFDIDAEGNVFVCRVADDLVADIVGRYYPDNGTISAIKYWVDNRVVGQSEVQNNPQRWYPQLLKFSPHMDSLLDSRYIVQNSDSVWYQTDNLYMKLNRNGNPYIIGSWSMSGEEHYNMIIVDSIQNMFFPVNSHTDWKGYAIKYNTTLNPLNTIVLKDSIVDSLRYLGGYFFHNVDFDYDSNIVVITGSANRNIFGDTVNNFSYFTVDDELTNLKMNSFVLILDDSTLKMKKYGQLTAITSYSGNGVVCAKNRIFMQTKYYGRITFLNTFCQTPNLSNPGLCFVYFDYNGRLIGGIDYVAISSNNNPGFITLRDSILYLSNYLVSDATFGDIYVPAQGYNACVAKYVDTSFMTPYVYTGDTGNVRIVVAEGGTWTSYPNPFCQRVNIEVEDGGLKVERAWLTDLAGRREEVRLQPNGPNRYVLDLTGRPQASYLLTLVTADGQERTLRLLKLQDMFGE